MLYKKYLIIIFKNIVRIIIKKFHENKTVLVIGSKGNIGKKLVARLKTRNFNVLEIYSPWRRIIL